MCSISHKLEKPLERAPQTTWFSLPQSGSNKPWCAGHPVAVPLLLAMLWLGLAQQVMSQTSPPRAGEAITIQYGHVTHHYLTTWEDDSLPAGVLRGFPPSTAPQRDDEPGNPSSTMQTAGKSASPDIALKEPTQDAAILYQLDLGERGMQMMVSAKTRLRPGHCIALERSGDITNLRRVSPAFCDPANEEVIDRLSAIRVVQAEHCIQALQHYAEQASAKEPNQELAQIAMLCDGG